MLELKLLGPVSLCRDGAALSLTIRKGLALLVLLAQAGALSRARVVALLWPRLDEASGRRNLRRELVRLREAGAGESVHAQGELLALSHQVVVDARSFDAALAGGDAEAALSLWRGAPGELPLDDAAEFDDWWAVERQRLLNTRRRALEVAAARCEAAGQVEAALQRVQALLDDDPLQEQRHRDAMRLLAAAGRREAALAQFERCRVLLREELGLVPMAETQALATALRAIAVLAPLAATTTPGPAVLPAGPASDAPARPASHAAAAPPLLPDHLPFVGRESEAAALEVAWAEGRCLILEGEGGVGKSRLALDFASAHGPHARVRSLSSDRAVPYATFTRALRLVCGPAPDLSALPPWVRPELARLLPELASTPPPPMQSAAERTRFLEACTQSWLALAGDSFDAVIFDDWQHADAASQSLLGFIVQRRCEPGDGGAATQPIGGAREIFVLRPEIDGEARATLQQLVQGSRALHLTLPPLPAAAVLELVQRLSGVAQPARFAARLNQATGGNPFFLAETLRHLAEQQLLAADEQGRWHTPFDDATQDYRELPLPPSVHQAVLARVQRLPVAAQRLLDAAALSSEPFAPALLAPACALSEIDAVHGIEAALQAQLLREHEAGGYAFAHDLVQQAIEATLGAQRRRLVHRRLALAAEASAALPALIALHHEASGDTRRAVAWRQAAGDAAMRVHALAEAVAQWQKGLADQPTPEQAVALRLPLMRALMKLDRRRAAKDEAQALAGLAHDPALAPSARAEAFVGAVAHLASDASEEQALALLAAPPVACNEIEQARLATARVTALRGLGQVQAAEEAAHAALDMPGLQGQDRADLLDSMSVTEHRAGRMQAALAHTEAAVALCAQLGHTFGVVRGMYRRGVFLIELGDLERGVQELQRGCEHCERYGFTGMQRGILYNLVCAYAAQTRPAQVLATARRGWDMQPPLPLNELRILFRLAFVEGHLALGDLGGAWLHACEAVDEALALGSQLALAGTAKACLELFALLGARAVADRLLAALDPEALRQMPHMADEMWIAAAQAAMLRGEPDAAAQALARVAAVEQLDNPRVRMRLAQAQAELALARGDAVLAMATVPSLDATGMNDELRLQALALRLRARPAGSAPPPEWVAAATAALAAAAPHAVGAGWLGHALSAACEDSGAAPADAARRPHPARLAHQAHLARLAASLESHTVQQAALLRAWG